MGTLIVSTTNEMASAVTIRSTGDKGDAEATYDGVTLTVPTASSAALSTAYISLKWHEIRMMRTPMMASSDWTQMPDSPLTVTQKTAWQTYRQALRDITKQPDPATITWPTPPGAI